MRLLAKLKYRKREVYRSWVAASYEGDKKQEWYHGDFKDVIWPKNSKYREILKHTHGSTLYKIDIPHMGAALLTLKEPNTIFNKFVRNISTFPFGDEASPFLINSLAGDIAQEGKVNNKDFYSDIYAAIMGRGKPYKNMLVSDAFGRIMNRKDLESNYNDIHLTSVYGGKTEVANKELINAITTIGFGAILLGAVFNRNRKELSELWEKGTKAVGNGLNKIKNGLKKERNNIITGSWNKPKAHGTSRVGVSFTYPSQKPKKKPNYHKRDTTPSHKPQYNTPYNYSRGKMIEQNRAKSKNRPKKPNNFFKNSKQVIKNIFRFI